MRQPNNSLKNPICQLAVMFALFVVIGRQLYLNWQQVASYKTYDYRLDYGFGIITILLFCLIAFFEPLIWAFVLRLLNSRLSLIKSIKVYSISTLARYIPGRIWNVASRIYLGKKEGLLQYALVVSLGIETLFMLLASVIIFSLSLLFCSNIGQLGKVVWSVSLIPLFLILSWPSVLKAIIRVGCRVLKKEEIPINFNFRDSLKLLFAYSLLWILYGATMFSLGKIIFPISAQLLPAFIGFFSISWALSYLTFLTPAGLGVREGVLVFLLSLYLPLAIAILISLLIRLCTIVVELTRTVVILMLDKAKLHLSSTAT